MKDEKPLFGKFQNGSNKVNFRWCNFGLKSYLWCQIEPALRARSILKSRAWLETKLNFSHFNYHDIKPLYTTLNNVHQFLKIRVFFHTLYLCNEVGDLHFFFSFLTQVTHNLTAVKNLKSIDWKTLLRERPWENHDGNGDRNVTKKKM